MTDHKKPGAANSSRSDRGADQRAHESLRPVRMLTFGIGDRVSFQPEGRPVVVGMLTRYNPKTVTVITGRGERWNAAPRLLGRPNDSHGADGSAAHVIRLRRK